MEAGWSRAVIEGLLRMRRFQWRIRTLLVVVAVAALLSAHCEMRRRGHAFSLRAAYHLAASEQLDRDRRSFWCGYGLSEEHIQRVRAERNAEWNVVQRAVNYHLRLHAKYQLAARRPWLPVESDPVPPPRANPTLASADEY
jgi:hypothetical protein